MPALCFVAGDPSGDAHAARLIEELKARAPDWILTGLGGPQMEQAGVRLLDDLTKAAAIGPFDAARHLSRLTRAKKLLEEAKQSPDPGMLYLAQLMKWGWTAGRWSRTGRTATY